MNNVPLLPPCDPRCGPDTHIEGCHQEQFSVTLTEAERETRLLNYIGGQAIAVNGNQEASRRELRKYVSDRLRTVEAERDEFERLYRKMHGVMVEQHDRAEKAEAKYEALRERVAALADEWESMPRPYGWVKVDALRAVLLDAEAEGENNV